ncbi:CRAL/TRIO domain-containing protein [Clavulina sp. PMI_390]|nr:CRAL/TRIO domain-containing protein [Clavulina sp. PMI_390]
MPADSKSPASNTAVPLGLNGYPGHLTPSELSALEKFRGLITDAKLYTPSSGTSRASHSETTLCRFLRARRFDPEKALKQFSDYEAWRKQHNVDELYRTFPVEEMELAKKYYPTWTGRRDRRGLPVYVYWLGSLDSKIQKELNAVSMERRYQRIVSLYEYMFHGIFNLSAALAPTTVPSSLPPDAPRPRTRDELCSGSTIIDLSSVSLMQLWGVKSHLQQSSTLGTAYYPETLDSILIVNSPSFFPTVWGWIQGWFDANTRNKIRILGNPEKDAKTREVLKSFISEENLPKAYGGTLEWKVGDPPNFDEEAKKWLKEVMGLEGEVPLRGPVFIDPYAKPGDSKRLSEVDSGVGLEPSAPAPATDSEQPKSAAETLLPATPAPQAATA